MTSRSPHCSTCGEPMPPGAPASAGHCPRCLFATSLGIGAADDGISPEIETAPWMRLSGLDLGEEIGRGGMGVVYRARQITLNRIVAVKVLLGAQFAGPEDRERFRREARAAAGLRHPGIVGILDFGEEDGLPWFSMEMVEGENLEDACRTRTVAPEEAAALVAEVADAVAHAHEHGILHRDLKPSNILLDAGGRPRISDFGIARSLGHATEAPMLTRTGQMVGSPGYAAPEQALHGQADVRTDVYGLGALLYHLLTGRPPFHGPTAESMLLQLRDNDPLPPGLIHPAVPRDLETICLKCLRKVPAARYGSAREVAGDLGRFLRGESILARPPGKLEQAWRWVSRHPAVAALLLVVALLSMGLVGASIWFARESARGEHRASLQAEARSLRQSRLAGSRLRSLDGLRQAWLLGPSREIRDEAVACLALADLQPVPVDTVFPVPSTGPQLEISPDRIIVRDATGKRELATFPGMEHGGLAVTDPSGTRLAMCAPGSGNVRLVSSDRTLSAVCPHPLPVEDIAWSSDLVATTCANRFIYIWDTRGNLKHRLSGHDAPGIRIAFRPGTQELASTAADNHVRLWHAARGAEILRLEHSHAAHTRLRWSADGRHLIGESGGGKEDIYQLSGPGIVDVLSPPQEEPHSENLGSADLSPDGRLGVAIDEDRARVWDFDRGIVVLEIPKQTGQWLGVKFHPGSPALLSCGWADDLRSWPLAARAQDGTSSPSLTTVLRQEPGNLLRDISADGKLIALSNNGNGTYTVVNGHGEKVVTIRQKATLACSLDPDGHWLATSGYDQPGLRIWSLPGGKPLATLCEGEIIMQTMPLGPHRLAAKSSARIRVFDTTDWKELPGPATGTRLASLTSTRDGRWLAGLGDHDIRILETEKFTEVLRLTPPAHAGWLGECHVAFDADGRHLLVQTALGCVMRWNLMRIAGELHRLGMDSGTPLPGKNQ